MRIRRVTLQNLNSLLGEHVVDFTVPPISDAGIFAITGPTGAGKTTLLDAVTLALYGRAARYGNAPNPADMMSRHTGECRAEVEFEVDGECYRAAWHLHRAKNSAAGKIQPSKRYVYGPGGEVLTQKLKDADQKIEELTGLNYQRFMRSVLLAQGEFARFLKAAEDERAELLESLTGTSVFSDLSRLAYEEFSSRQRNLDDAELKLGLIQPLPDEERTAIEADAQTAKTQLASLKAKLKRVAAQIATADSLREQLATESKLLAKQADLDAGRKAQRAPLESLARHRTAEPFLPALDRLDEANKHAAEQKSLATAAAAKAAAARADKLAALSAARSTGEAAIAATQKTLDTTRAAANTAEKSRADTDRWLLDHHADAALENHLPELVATITNLASQAKTLTKSDSEISDLATERQAAGVACEAADKASTQSGIKAAKTKQTKCDTAEALAGALGDRTAKQWQAEAEGLVTFAARSTELAKAAARETETRRQLDAQTTELPSQKKTIDALKAARDSAGLLAESHQKHLADSRLIASLEQHRQALRDGEPCPLCGAEAHPLCDENLSPTPPSELESQLATASKSLAKATRTYDAANAAHTTLEAQIASGRSALKTVQNEIAALSSAITTARDQLSLNDADIDAEQLLAANKKQLATIESAGAAAQRAEKDADAKQHAAAAATTAARTATAASAALDTRLAKLRKQAETQRIEIDTSRRALATSLRPYSLEPPKPGAEAALRATIETRAKDYADQQRRLATATETLKSSHRQEAEHAKTLSALRKRLADIDTLLDGHPPGDPGSFLFASLDEAADAVRRLESAATTLAAAANERAEIGTSAHSTATSQQKALATRLATSPLADIDTLLTARLTADEVARLTEIEKSLTAESQQIKGALASCREALAKLRAAAVPEGDALDALRENHTELDSLAEAQSDRFAASKASLKNDDACRAKHRSTSAALAEQRGQLGVWRQLAGLIGSHDGKKFRVFAQGLSLDILLRHANAHLTRLSDRYQLTRSPGQDLGVEIIDLFQASVPRPMASLSGGESFLASLALALGLSDLAGRNVQIDSLFIDEGFGTLDAESLDIALAALESLRQQDKTVGVISHIDLLKERIATQIVVERSAGGTSTIRVIDK